MRIQTAELMLALRLNPYLRVGTQEETLNWRLDTEAAIAKMGYRARTGILMRAFGVYSEDVGKHFGVSASVVCRDRGYLDALDPSQRQQLRRRLHLV